MIDRTPPAILVSGVSDGELSNASDLIPVVSATDDNLARVAALLDGAPFASGTPVGSEGAHTLVVTAADLAGNTSTQAVHFVLDRTPPAILIGGVSDGELSSGPVTATFTATDANLGSASATLDGSPFASGATVGTDGAHVLVVTAADLAGNVSAAIVHFTIATTPPQLVIRAPADGSAVSSHLVTVVADVSAAAGVASVSANGIPMSIGANGSYSATVPLVEGTNTIAVTAVDRAGNQSTQTISVFADTQAPQLDVVSPAEGAHVGALSVLVTGDVRDASPVMLTIDGAAVAVNADGTFSTIVPLLAGADTIAVVATDAAGNSSSITRSVRANTTPPLLAVRTPVDGSTTTAASALVTGGVTAGDPTDTASVTVNGLSASLAADGTFSVAEPLALGANVLHVVATDSYGFQSTVDVAVTREPAPTAALTVSPGSGPPGTAMIIGGSGFHPAAVISIRVDGLLAGQATADFNGAFASFVVPVLQTAPAGPSTITASDGLGSSADTTFTVT